jgi:hypothetical protein
LTADLNQRDALIQEFDADATFFAFLAFYQIIGVNNSFDMR